MNPHRHRGLVAVPRSVQCDVPKMFLSCIHCKLPIRNSIDNLNAEDAGVAIKGFTIFLLPPQRKINEVIGLLSAIFGY
jgi:hypothetical protein